MLGPSGFFVPNEFDDNPLATNELELIHTSLDGFNILYRGCKNGRFFIYKALKPEYAEQPVYKELMKKDFNIGFSLNHPSICQYYAMVNLPKIGNCIVMEWIDGETLEVLIKNKRISKEKSQKIICELCDALGYMHSKQIIHRDLKPENIMITHNGQNVKVIDFGLSDADSYGIFKVPAGTWIYASPELASGETIDNRSDIWSLGMIISEMHPYYKHIAEGCLVRNRDKRFSSAEDVRKAVLNEGVRRFWKRFIWLVVIIAISSFSAITLIMSESKADRYSGKAPAALPSETEVKDSLTLNEAKEAPVKPYKTPARPEKKAPTPSEESIDATSLENLFNDALKQIF